MVEIEDLGKAYAENLVRRETKQFGLRYAPSLEPGMSDDADRHFDHTQIQPLGGMFSDRNEAALRAAMASVGELRTICEIGCWAPNTRVHSSTDCLCENKPDGCWYYGVDLKDEGRRGHIHRPEDKRQVFIQADSIDHSQVFTRSRWLDYPHVGPCDLLFIDGLHSVGQVLADWRYAEWVRPGGLVIMHDVNYHPGPRLVFDAVDPAIFDKASVCPQADDFGLGILRRK